MLRKLFLVLSIALLAVMTSTPAHAQTNTGRDFWLAETPNLGDRDSFAISVANPGAVPAMISITNPVRPTVNATIAPGTLRTFLFRTESDNTQSTGTYANNVYHVTSNQDVVVYTFTPLVNAFSNDAALILPKNSLGTKYRPGSYNNPLGNSHGSFFGVVATENNTNVKTYNRTGSLVDNVTINQGQYFQRNNGTTPAQDITGWYVETDKPAAVFGGNICTSLGNSTAACDHIDEQILPAEAMASAYVASPTNSRPIGCTGPANCAPDVFRYVAIEDNTVITTNPNVGGGTIDKGEFIEITTSTPHIVNANKPFYGYQFLISQDAGSPAAGTGDPAMLAMPPVDQFQFTYLFLTPTTYTYDFINVVAPVGTTFVMDGSPVGSTCTPIGSLNGVTYCSFAVRVTDGAHSISANKKFGLSISGFDQYASYAYVGGIGLQAINAGCNTGGPYQMETCNLSAIQLNGIATCSDNSSPTSIQWTSSDGVVFSNPAIANPTATVPGYGTFNITLTVNCGGSSVTCSSTITVTEPAGGCNTITRWYRDWDKDGFGDPKRGVDSPVQPAGYVSNDDDCNDYRVFYEDVDHDGWGNSNKVPCGLITRTGDCNDNDRRVHSLQTFYRDADGDSWGNAAVTTVLCSSIPPEGFVKNRMDCNDNDKNIRYCPVAPSLTMSNPDGNNREQKAALTLAALPNPFGKSARLQYTLPMDAYVNIRVFDELGREVVSVFNGHQKAGTYNTELGAQRLTRGVYHCRITATANGNVLTQSQKLMKTE